MKVMKDKKLSESKGMMEEKTISNPPDVPGLELSEDCPHCWRCPHCGRGGRKPFDPFDPFDPWDYTYPYPIVTWSISDCNGS